MTNDETPKRDYENPFVLLEMTVLDCSINAVAPQQRAKDEKQEGKPHPGDLKSEGADKVMDSDQ